MTKIILKKTTNAIFLTIVLIAGTLAAISPLFMIGAHAEQYYGMDQRYHSYQPEYGTDYGMDSYDKKPYGKDNSYDTSKDSNGISIDTPEGSGWIISEIPVGGAPTGIAHDPVNGHMYVTNQADDTVHVIDTATNEIIREIPVGDAPTGIAFDSVNGQMYVTNQHDNTVHVININNGDINNGLIDQPGDNGMLD